MKKPLAPRAPGPKRPTLADVARRAGVAPVTVSRALNTPDVVNPRTLKRINTAVAALGYQMNSAARALAGSKWNTVGVLIPSLDHIMVRHELMYFEAELSARNISLLVSATNYDPEAEHKVLSGLIQRGVDAILLTHLDRPEVARDLLQAANVPHVIMSNVNHELFPHWVGQNEREALSSVVDHLLDLGHRSIGMIGDKRAVKNGKFRVEAVAARLKQHGLSLTRKHLHLCGADEQEAREAFKTIMTRGDRPSAIICGNDDLALAALGMAHEMGISVPSDVSITGYDGAQVTGHPLISLTTVRTSWRRRGAASAEMIVSAIEGEEIVPVLTPTELLIRDSTGTPNVDHWSMKVPALAP